MKMNFLLRNKNFLTRDSNKSPFLSIIVVIFFIIIFSLFWTKNMLFSVGTPLWTIKNNINSFLLNNIGILNSKKNLLKENGLLKEQIRLDEKNRILFDLLKKENDNLKNILNVKGTNQNLLLSAVLVKPFLSPYDTLIIDVGLSNGVNVGDQVLFDGNIFIGYISEVYKNTSKVILYSSPGEKVGVLIGSNNIGKEAIGLGGGNFKVEIPKEIGVKEGDFVIIPSISTNFFGIVEKIEIKSSDSFQNVLFKNPVNIAELKWVEVLIQNQKSK